MRNRIFLWAAGGEAIAAAIYLAAIPGDPKNSLIFGFSLFRLINIGAVLAIGAGFFLTGIWLDRLGWLKKWFENRSENLKNWQKTIWLDILLLLVIWVFPIYRLRDFDLIWERILPSVSLLVGLLLTFLGLMLIEGRGRGYFSKEALWLDKRFGRLWLVTLVGVYAVLVAARATGFGIIPPIDRFWNTAGVPVLFEQVLYLILGFVFVVGIKTFYFQNRSWRVPTWLVFVLLWLAAFVVWNAQPIAKSYFVYQPSLPNYEYYPLSDAQRFDLGGKFLLVGQGIYNGITEEKPFLMAYMALLSVVAGPDYSGMVQLQVLILSLIVPFLYLIGRRLKSDLFGVGLAAIGIFYEVNTIDASVAINSAHIKLLLSEPLTYLGVVLVVYTLMRWLEDLEQGAWGIATLGLIGFFAYVRASVILLYPAVLVMLLINDRSRIKSAIKSFFQANVGFIGVFAPWMTYAYVQYGYVPLLNKIIYVIQNRFKEVWRMQLPASTKLAALSPGGGSGLLLAGAAFWDGLYLQAAHFINNLIASLLIFPTTFRTQSISAMLDQPYWHEEIIWDGAVSVLFYLNAAIILVGVVYLARTRKLIGLAPLVIALAYNLASSLAMTSGGRYLKPSIWIFVLYYLAGIYYLVELLFSAMRFSVKSIEHSEEKEKARPQSQIAHKRVFWAAISAFWLIGFLIPGIDAAIPEKYPKISTRQVFKLFPDEVFSQFEFNHSDLSRLLRQKKLTIYYGDGFYPRQVISADGLDYFGFSVVGPYPALDARFFGSWDMIEEFPDGSLVLAIGCGSQSGGDFYSDIVLLYLPEQDAAYFVGTDWQAICPSSP